MARLQKLLSKLMPMLTRFKNYFLRGLAVLLPTILTIWIFLWGYQFIQNNIGVFINYGIVWLIVFFENDHTTATFDSLVKFWVNGFGSAAGFFIALIAICALGIILASVVGKTLWHTAERFIMNTPLLKKVYPYVKQLTDFLLNPETSKKQEFIRVVAIEFPRPGIWVIGLVTGTGISRVSQELQKECLTVFVPTTPTPFTGFTTMIPKEQTIDLDMTVEEAVRFVVSGGVIAPMDKISKKQNLTLRNDERLIKSDSLN
jgi:uncharacterized membrane protein